MSCLLEHQDACLPITAITGVGIDGSRFVFAGVGPRVLLIDESSGTLLDNIRVFERNAVHGLHVLFSGSLDTGKFYAKILSRGGHSLRVVKLTLQKLSGKNSISLSLISPECLCPDWVLDTDSCGQPRDSTSSTDRSNVGLITAHNTLLCVELRDDNSETASIDLHEIPSSLKPILYSADIHWITPNRILVAAGTVFGEIVVWSCRLQEDTQNPPFSESSICVHHFFTGHEGSIFGVSISPEITSPGERESRRFLASCSDDRTIRVWDISSCSSGGPEGSSLSMDRNIRATGFGTYIGELDLNQNSCLAKVWAHDARIWGVRFLGVASSEKDLSVKVISYSEDATCQLWDFRCPPDTLESDDSDQKTMTAHLSHLKTYKYHTGRHVWSLASRESPCSFTVYSGGADGNLISFVVGRHFSDPRGDQRLVSTADDIIDSLTNTRRQPADFLSPTTVKKKKDEPRIAGYSFVGDNCFIAASSEGRILLGCVKPRGSSRDDDADGYQVSWETVAMLDGIPAYNSIEADPQQQFGVIAAKSGDIWLYDHRDKSIQKVAQVGQKVVGLFIVETTHGQCDSSFSRLCSFVVSFFGATKVDLFCVRTGESPSILSRNEFSLPPKFLVMDVAIVEATGQMILSSRQGAIASYDLEKHSGQVPIEPSWCISGVHSGDAVTSISNIKQPSSSDPAANYILTTGRDGNYCVHELVAQTPGLRTVHKTSPIRLKPERATFEASTNDLLLLGFRGTLFVLWNESTQSELMTVECGGVHRTWVYHSGKFGNLLIWNRASTFHALPWTTPSHRALRAGGHGREIKTIAISPSMVRIAGRKRAILATGGEDTLIRLFMLDEEEKTQPAGSFQCVRTVKHHGGGMQHLQWSSSARHLFSSSGAEEFQAWRVRYIPGFGMGVVAEGEYPKGKPNSDLRITHFHVVDVEVEDESADAFLISMCYSNSVVKVFYYLSNPQWCYYTLLAQGRYTSNCLTHIQLMFSKQTQCLVTTATDGCVATWDATPVLKSTFSISNGAIKVISSPALSSFSSSPSSLTWQNQHHVHQSSIKSMTTFAVSEKVDLIITGGDDNALAFSILDRTLLPSTASESGGSTTTLLHDAHASAINDVTILRTGMRNQEVDGENNLEIQIASSGNDQRLKVWLVQIPLSGEGINTDTGRIRVSLREDVYTAVADLSCMGTFTPGDTIGDGWDAERMVLCGVGMDMWTVKQS